MRHGDLSNTSGYTIAFYFEELVKLRDFTLKDKIFNKVSGELKRCTLDQRVLQTMEYLYSRTSSVVDIVVDESFYLSHPDLKDFLEERNVPFRNLVVVQGFLDISIKLRTGQFSYYVDSNPYRRNLINNTFAVSINYANSLFKHSKETRRYVGK